MENIEQCAERIFERLDIDIRDRRGLKFEWRQINPSILYGELKEEWIKIIKEEIERET